MAMVTNRVQSSASTVSRATYSLNNTELGINQARDVSFSSYLNPGEETFVHKLVQSGQHRSLIADPKADNLYYLGCKEADAEIGVFEAEKYFNGEIDGEEDSPKSATPSKKLVDLEHKKKEGKGERRRDIDAEPVRAKLQLGTPSIHSESSLNSQRALLRNNTRNPGKDKNCSRSLLRAVLGCKCSCSDKDSIDVVNDDNACKFGTSLNARSNSVGIFHAHASAALADPWASDMVQSYKAGMFGNFSPRKCMDLPPLKPEDGGVMPRKSLEVFGSPLFGKRANDQEILGMERKLPTLSTWGANPRKEAGAEALEDTESDASSDLFEIESLTGKVNSYLTRQTSEATSDCVTPTTARYAPSEASIEWSVVTASAADFSVLSDTEEAVSGGLATSKGQRHAKNGINHGMTKRRPMSGILLGCKSQKAVQVSGEALRARSQMLRSDPRAASGWRSNLLANPVARFQAEARLTGFDPKYRKNASRLVYIGD